MSDSTASQDPAPLPLRVVGRLDATFRGKAVALAHPLATRSHGLQLARGYFEVGAPATEAKSAVTLAFELLTPIWLRHHDPAIPDSQATWRKVTLRNAELKVERHGVLRESARCADVRVFGTLSAEVVSEPATTDYAPLRGCLTTPFGQPQGCGRRLGEFGVPVLFWGWLGWLPALVWLAVRWAAGLLAVWSFPWPTSCACLRRPGAFAALLGLLVVLPLGSLVSLLWAWLTGECPQLLMLRGLLLVVPLWIAAWLSRHPVPAGSPDWPRRARRLGVVLWTCAVPLLWWARQECREPWINWLAAALMDVRSRDPDADLVARRDTSGARRTSIDEAMRNPWTGGKACGQTLHLSGDLLFDRGSDRLRGSGATQLRKLATLLRRSPDAEVLLTGHADQAGDADFNRELSERRARAIERALLAAHVTNSEHLRAEGRGSAQPLVQDGGNPVLGRFNRRVEVVVTCPAQEEP